MKITALITLLLLTSLAYGQSKQAHLKGKNEIGLNYNSLFEVNYANFQTLAEYSYISLGYGKWVLDKSVLGGNVNVSLYGEQAWRWNANVHWKQYLVSYKHFGLYGKAEVGVSQGRLKASWNGDDLLFVTTSTYGSLGVGMEYRITPNWTVFGEANYQRWFILPEKRDFISLSTGIRSRF